MNRASQGSFSFPSRIIPRDTFISGTPASVFHEGPAHSVYRNHAPGKLPVNEPSLSFPRKRENLICPTHENIQTASPFSPAACDSAGCHAKTMLPETDMCQCILMDSFMRTNGRHIFLCCCFYCVFYSSFFGIPMTLMAGGHRDVSVFP